MDNDLLNGILLSYKNIFVEIQSLKIEINKIRQGQLRMIKKFKIQISRSEREYHNKNENKGEKNYESKVEIMNIEKIKTENIDNTNININSIKSNNIKSNSIKSNSININSIKSNSIKSNSIKSNSIKSNSIKSNSIKSNSIKSNSIESNSIKSIDGTTNSTHIHTDKDNISKNVNDINSDNILSLNQSLKCNIFSNDESGNFSYAEKIPHQVKVNLSVNPLAIMSGDSKNRKYKFYKKQKIKEGLSDSNFKKCNVDNFGRFDGKVNRLSNPSPLRSKVDESGNIEAENKSKVGCKGDIKNGNCNENHVFENSDDIYKTQFIQTRKEMVQINSEQPSVKENETMNGSLNNQRIGSNIRHDKNNCYINEGNINEGNINEVNINEGNINDYKNNEYINNCYINEGNIRHDKNNCYINEGNINEVNINEGNINEVNINDYKNNEYINNCYINEGNINEGNINEVNINEDNINEGKIKFGVNNSNPHLNVSPSLEINLQKNICDSISDKTNSHKNKRPVRSNKMIKRKSGNTKVIKHKSCGENDSLVNKINIENVFSQIQSQFMNDIQIETALTIEELKIVKVQKKRRFEIEDDFVW